MGASLAFLRYTDCEHPGKVNRFLDRKGSANKVFNLKDELGPRQEWRRKLQEMGARISLLMMVADSTSGGEDARQSRIALLNRLIEHGANVHYKSDIGVSALDVCKSKGAYYPLALLDRLGTTLQGLSAEASVSIISAKDARVL